ncbi:polyketide synthase, partial [Kitasatospora nipponensis]|uniref:polyketide synthase n=1 Tax=Kitasatospora nipponensis TaxID=258049 RepID=UPI0031D79395
MRSDIGSPGTGHPADIAVIGMAIRAPQADDLGEFLANLRTGRDSVRELSADRRRRTSLPPDADYQLSGYLDDIDTFDHAFFGLSKGEAQCMAPEHRLLLQVAYQAVENAGYDPTALRGRRAAVYVGATRLRYPQLTTVREPMMVMGNHAAATAGRIARFLGLRGPAAMVDSSCSSSLLALHHAVNDLVLGDAELALVGGVNLNLIADRRNDPLDLGIRSADGRTRCFSAEADGTGSGEAAVTVLLKPLAQALRDGDPVHAVIKATAANNVGGRSSTLTAPDSAAEAEVIARAWEKSGVDPATISYIEAHGTATRLGDPIEIEAIDLAFAGVTERRGFCAVSSVKSNIGHTWSVSGLVGLVKAVLALRTGQLFANLHAARLSPLIDFAHSATTVTRELTPWEPAGGVRRAGVSSFGVMGTNVHAVLEQAPTVTGSDTADTPDSSEASDASDAATAGRFWFPVSARSAASLAENLAALRDWLAERPALPLADVARTLVEGRAHYPYRWCASAADRTELAAALVRATEPAAASAPAPAQDPAPAEDAAPSADPTPAEPVLALVVSGRCTASPALTAALRRAHPRFDLLHTRCERADGWAGDDPRHAAFAFQYALHGLLRELGLEPRHVVGEGAGRYVLDVANDRRPLTEALRLAGDNEPDPAAAPDLDARVDRLLAGLTGGQPVLFVEAGPLSTVSGALAE